MSELINELLMRLREWRYRRKLDRLSADLGHMQDLRDFAAREADRIRSELIKTWREAEGACRDEP